MSFVQSIKKAIKDGSPMLFAGETMGSFVSKHRGRRYRILIMTAKKQRLIPPNAESIESMRHLSRVRSAAAHIMLRREGRFCSKEDGVAAALPLAGAAKRKRREELEVSAAVPVLRGAAKHRRREEAKDAAAAPVLERGGSLGCVEDPWRILGEDEYYKPRPAEELLGDDKSWLAPVLESIALLDGDIV
jgi:hypothetical protein